MIRSVASWFSSFFSDESGKGSYGRLCSFLTLLLVLRMAWAASPRAESGIPENLESLAIFFLMLTGPYLVGKGADLAVKVKNGKKSTES